MQTYTQGCKLLSKKSSLSDELQVEHKPLLNEGDLSKLDHITEVDISWQIVSDNAIKVFYIPSLS